MNKILRKIRKLFYLNQIRPGPRFGRLLDVDRAITLSDLSISDLTASIAIELPKKWDERFKSKASFKRVTKTSAEAEEAAEGTDSTDDTDTTGGDNTGGNSQGGGSTIPGEGD